MRCAGHRRRFVRLGRVIAAGARVKAPIRAGLTVEFSLTGRQMLATWSPAPPKRLSASEIAIYRRARDHFLANIAAIRGPGTVVDLERGGAYRITRIEPAQAGARVSASTKPTAPAPDWRGIHPDLRVLPQWVGWRYVEKGGRFTKVPVRCSGGSASSTDRATWSTFAEARAAYESGGLDGVGFVTSPDDPYVLIDLDHVIDAATGELAAWAAPILEAARREGAYIERSPSGTGHHIIGRGPQGFKGQKRHDAEIYCSRRFFTITGDSEPLPDTLGELVETARLVRARIEGEPKARNSKPASSTPTNSSDAELIELARRANNGAKFSALYDGNVDAYASGSEADLALAGMLAFWTGPHPERIETLMRASALRRDKWDTLRDGVTYLRRTIDKALEGKSEFYEPGRSGTASRPSVANSHSAQGEPIDWPEPLNLFSELVAPPYQADSVPAVLSDYAAGYAQATGIDPSITLGAAVVAAAGAISDGFSIVADSRSQWLQEARLWLIDIAKPGAGKTPGQRAMLAPLWQIQREITTAHGVAVAAQLEGEPKLHRPRVVVADTTIEALSEILRDQPRGLLIANDEFETWLGSMDMYRRTGGASRDRGEWLRLFDGGPHTVERIQRGSVHVPNWGVSIMTAATPATMAKVMRQLPEDGLLQRFIPIVARRQIITDGDASGLEPLRTAYEQTLRRLYFAEPRAHKGAVPLSYEAAVHFREWRIENQRLQEALGSITPALESHVAKYPTLLLRLALVYHCAKVVNYEHEGARDPAAWPLPVATLLEAARFLKTASRHALALYGSMNGSSATFDLARTIGRAVLASSSDTTERRLLIQRVRAFRAAEPYEQDAALRLLVDAGWLRPSDSGYELARPARYDINPQVRNLFAREAQAEKARRAAVRDAISDTVTGVRHDAAA
jgi:hypothetical protein